MNAKDLEAIELRRGTASRRTPTGIERTVKGLRHLLQYPRQMPARILSRVQLAHALVALRKRQQDGLEARESTNAEKSSKGG
jgi:hypothetical protein